MRSEVVAHAQRLVQVHHLARMADEVVVVDVAYPHFAQQRCELRLLGGPVKVLREALALIKPAQAHHALGQGRKQQENCVPVQMACQLFHMPLCAPAPAVRHGQNARQRTGAQPRHVQALAVGACRVALHMFLHGAGVPGVQALQGGEGGLFARALVCAEAHAAGVQHEGVERLHVAPAQGGGALAEVVFLAVADAEVFHVEQAHLAQAVAPDVHAKAHRRGDVDDRAGLALGAQRVQRGSAPALGQGVGLAKARVAANGGVAGKGGDGADARMAIGRSAQAVEPVVGDFGVAVEQQHILRVAQRHAPVDGGDEAEVFCVLQQGDARLARRERAQPVGERRLGAGIVDDDQARRGLVAAVEYRLQAALGVFQPFEDRHDDVYARGWCHGGGIGGSRLGRCGGGGQFGGRGGAASQRLVEANLGVHQRAGGTDDGGVPYLMQVCGQSLVLLAQLLQCLGCRLVLRQLCLGRLQRGQRLAVGVLQLAEFLFCVCQLRALRLHERQKIGGTQRLGRGPIAGGDHGGIILDRWLSRPAPLFF